MYYTCTIIKNEHRYLREWIDHCLSIGFDEIHLYEDEGSESHSSITNAYPQVYLHSIKEVSRTDYQGKDWKQVDMAQHFIKTLSHKGRGSSWCAFIDPDEYIRFEEGYTLQRLCEEFKNYRGIYLQFKIYGANGHIERPDGGVVENYGSGEAMPYRFFKTNHKSLVNLSYTDHVWSSVHHVQCGLWTDGKQRRRTSWAQPEIDLCYKKAWIDHYYTKSWQDWIGRFTYRGDVVPGNVKVERFFFYNKGMKIPYDRSVHNEMVRINNILDEGYVVLNDDLAGVLISKCALSTLCGIGSKYSNRVDNSWLFDYKGEHQRCKSTDKHSFMVWRDPVGRFKSFYQNKVINGGTGAVLVDVFGLKGESIDDMISMAESIINNEEYELIDSHIRPLVYFVDKYRHDDIVNIKDLDAYLLSHGITPIEHQNSSGDYHIELTAEQEQRIRTLYAADYEILKSPKLWKPCTTSVQ